MDQIFEALGIPSAPNIVVFEIGGASQISVIKLIRDFTGLSLKASKELVDYSKRWEAQIDGLTIEKSFALARELRLLHADAYVERGGDER
jgi:ribosomal protein L7/L12